MTAAAPLVPLLVSAGAYLFGVARLGRRRDRWPPLRTAAALGGLCCLAVAVAPPLANHDEDFRVHVVQHLLLASAAPLLLALSAPVTLALRVLPPAPRRVVLRVLRTRAVRVLTGAGVALCADVGGLYALYLTPAFAVVEGHPLLHAAVHVVLAGCLLSWYLVGVDPVAHRAGVRTRLIVLVTAAGAHDVLAKAMYARVLPAGAGSTGQIRTGAQIMFYGGDAVEVLLAITVLTHWYRRTGRALARDRHRAQPSSRPATAP